jgi:hypothetical protein
MNSQRFDYTGFTRIRVERALSIDILRADTYSVTIGDDFSRIRMEKIGDTLCIERRSHEWFVPFHARPHVVVTMPVLKEINMGGACQGKIIGFQSSNDLIIKMGGACQMETNAITAGNVKAEVSGASNLSGDMGFGGEALFNISGASRVVLQGSGNNARIQLSGASQARLGGMALRRVDLNISGASNAQIKVNDHLDVTVTGASRLEYSGNPNIGKMLVSGASSINHR